MLDRDFWILPADDFFPLNLRSVTSVTGDLYRRKHSVRLPAGPQQVVLGRAAECALLSPQ